MIGNSRRAFADSFVRMIGLHDAQTATHLRATAVVARRIARHLLLDDAVVETIELGALLHDIGKICVRRDVICKQAALSAAEWSEMRLHAQFGGDVLAEFPLLSHLAPIVRAHHERLDGRGYPDNLRGDEIPFEARVIAVADAFAVLTTNRPYRRAITQQAALNVLHCAAGFQFDSDVVSAMLELLSNSRPARRRTA